jgi:NADH-quinone oxidoreductase subunit M
MLVPMYLLIGIWGGPRKLYAAIKFFLYTLLGSVLMLLGILFLYFHHYSVTSPHVYTFSIPELYKTAPLIPFHYAVWLFVAFFIGFAIKVPMFPFHTWLPDAHVEAPTAGSVILAGVLLKMGTYGFVRFTLPFFPQVLSSPATFLHVTARGWMILLSLIGIIYGALVSLMQKDMKKLVAYSSVSHLGFCTLGIFALNSIGLTGSVLQQINHGISTGALFLIVGILYERRHTREIAAAEWVCRRVHDFAGSIHRQLEMGGVGGAGRGSGRGLLALALSARLLWDGDESQERKAARSYAARNSYVRAADHYGVLDRPVSEALLPDTRPTGQSDCADAT